MTKGLRRVIEITPGTGVKALTFLWPRGLRVNTATIDDVLASVKTKADTGNFTGENRRLAQAVLAEMKGSYGVTVGCQAVGKRVPVGQKFVEAGPPDCRYNALRIGVAAKARGGTEAPLLTEPVDLGYGMG